MTGPATAENPWLPTPLRVANVIPELEGTVTLEFDVSGLPGGFRFAPGQFNMIYVFGTGEVPISISGDPAAPDRLVHTVRSVGLATQTIVNLAPGSILGVRGPFGSSWPVAAAEGRDLVIVAGGLGLAPLRPAILHAIGHRERYRSITVLYGSRTPADVLYPADLAAWKKRGDVEVGITVDQAGTEWSGHVGVVPSLLADTRFDAATAIAMVCGPEVMMKFTARALGRRGITDDRIFLSLERNMKCAMGFCGHCQFGPQFVCKDGPVFRYDQVARLMAVREV